MATKPQRKQMRATELTADYALNVREHNRYELDIMCDQIVIAKRIMVPLIVEKMPDGKHVVLVGNRRIRAAQMMVADPNVVTAILLKLADSQDNKDTREKMKASVATDTAEVLENLNKIECQVYEGLTPDEREEYIMDHGKELQLCRTEIALVVARKAKAGKSEWDIIRSMYFAIAKYTGNERKLAEVPKEAKEKELFLKKWLHGTIGNQILAAYGMGAYVWDQFILTRRSEDRLLKEGEKVEMLCSTKRISELTATKNADKKDPASGWDQFKGGTSFNKMVQQFKDEDAGILEVEKKVRPTVKELQAKAGQFRCPGIVGAFLAAAGENTDNIGRLDLIDDQLFRDQEALKVLAAARNELPKDLAEFVGHVLHDTPNQLNDYLATKKVASENGK